MLTPHEVSPHFRPPGTPPFSPSDSRYRASSSKNGFLTVFQPRPRSRLRTGAEYMGLRRGEANAGPVETARANDTRTSKGNRPTQVAQKSQAPDAEITKRYANSRRRKRRPFASPNFQSMAKCARRPTRIIRNIPPASDL